jgi:glycosyltransferase involved in cell wall biosynthesis
MATVVENLSMGLATRVAVRNIDNRKTTAADRTLVEGVSAQLTLLGRLALNCVRWRPHVVHVHTCSWNSFWRNAIDVVLARILGRKVLLHIHGGQFLSFLDSLGKLEAKAARTVFRLADIVVVLGDEWVSGLQNWCDRSKLQVVPNGVPVKRMNSGIDDSKVTILCLANYGVAKGQRDLLRSVAALRSRENLQLLLVGDEADQDERRYLEKLSDELEITDIVQITGPKTGPEKEALLAQTDIFCLPSYYEGLPMAMLEAMAVGVPVIASHVGSIPEVIIDNENGLLIDAGDIQSLSSQIQRLASDRELRKKIGTAGHKCLQEKYSIEKSVDTLCSIYQKLMDHKQ